MVCLKQCHNKFNFNINLKTSFFHNLILISNIPKEDLNDPDLRWGYLNIQSAARQRLALSEVIRNTKVYQCTSLVLNEVSSHWQSSLSLTELFQPKTIMLIKILNQSLLYLPPPKKKLFLKNKDFEWTYCTQLLI